MNKILKRIGYLIVCTAIVFSAIGLNTYAAIGQTDYVIDSNGKSSLPMCYIPEKRIERVYEGSYLDTPLNMHIDDNDNLYVADSANNRIVKFDSELEYVGQFTAGDSLNKPSGAYYDAKNKELYIADTDNQRIVVVGESDNIVKEYFRPESELLGDTLTFDPTNVSLGIQGHIYILKGQNFMQIGQDGEFKGFVGSTKVGANIITALVRRFASEKQKKLLVTEQPSPYVNFTMDKNGVIYAVAGTETSQIRKINMVGDNLYPEKFYGEMVLQDGWRMVRPSFTSIAVSNDGIISVLEEKSKQIYQYTQEGVMLNVFGGEGEVAGFFKSPTAIAVDSMGSVLVADSSNNTVQRFTRTPFAAAVYEAQVAYDNGNYEEAYELFSKAKAVNPNYSVLNNGMAECLYKMKRLDEAAELYKFANNREGYGKVQADKRKMFIRENFGLVCLAILVAVVLVIFAVYKLKKYAVLLVRRFYHLDD